MKKIRRFKRTFFNVEVLDKAAKALDERTELLRFYLMAVDMDDDVSWVHDKVDEFYSDYRKRPKHATLHCKHKSLDFGIQLFDDGDTVVRIEGPRDEIERVMRVFEDAAPSSVIPAPPPKPTIPPVVFIGHGHSPLWRDLKDHLHEKHGYAIEAFEIGAREGHAVRDILESMLRRSDFALLVMTGEDGHTDGSLHARENVIHEAGLFQGRFGFTRAIVLLEDGCAEFSNIAGICQLRFAKGKIKEIYGDVLAILRREFGEPPK